MAARVEFIQVVRDKHRRTDTECGAVDYSDLSFHSLVSITIIASYTITKSDPQTIVVYHPTVSMFEQLALTNHSSLSCPCTTISIPYENFVHVDTIVHPICSTSPYVVDLDDEWLKLAFDGNNHSYRWPMDVRKTFTASWTFIRSFCIHSQLILHDALSVFNATSLATGKALTRGYILSAVVATLNQLQITAPASLVRTLATISQTASSNLFVSAWDTNFAGQLSRLETAPEQSVNFYSNYYALDGSVDWCICWLGKSCPIPLGIYNYQMMSNLNLTGNMKYNLSEIRANSSIQGLYGDCLPLDGVLISSLECFYSLECIRILRTAMPYLDLPLLSETLLRGYFTKQSTINEMANRLMVDEWMNETLYEEFYHICAPLACTYLFSKRNNIIYVVTTILGLLGGLTVALRCVMPIIVRFVMNKICKQHRPLRSTGTGRGPKDSLFISAVRPAYSTDCISGCEPDTGVNLT